MLAVVDSAGKPRIKNTREFQVQKGTTKPPFFTGSDYLYWKKRMEIFIQADDYEQWIIVNEGPFVPYKEVEGEYQNKVKVVKTSSELTEQDKVKLTKNAKALNTLYSGLNEAEFSRVYQCGSANEVWRLLELFYEGNAQVKEAKKSLYMSEYEMFQMKAGESLNQMHLRFLAIVNNLSSLGQTYPNEELNWKILRVLPKDFKQKVVCITELTDLSKMTVNELISNLQTEEIILNRYRLMDEKEEKMKKSLTSYAKDDDGDGDDDEEGEELEDIDMAVFARYLKRSMKRRKNGDSSNFIRKQGKEHQSEESRCFNCNTVGHVKANCPKLTKFKSKKVKNTNWDDFINSEDDDEVKAL